MTTEPGKALFQIFFLGTIIDYLCQAWGQFPDHRQPNNNTQYQIVDGVLAAFAVFFMQSPSFLAHQRTMKGKRGRSNAETLFQIQHLPSDPQIRNLLDPLLPSHFEPDFEWLLHHLDQWGGLAGFRDYQQTWLVALDGVVYFSSTKISCSQCSQRKDATGQVHYYHAALTPVIVKPARPRVGGCLAALAILILIGVAAWFALSANGGDNQLMGAFRNLSPTETAVPTIAPIPTEAPAPTVAPSTDLSGLNKPSGSRVKFTLTHSGAGFDYIATVWIAAS